MLKTPVRTESVFGDDDDHIRHQVAIQMRSRIGGGVPNNPKTIEGWIETNFRGDEEAKRALMFQTLRQLGYNPGDMTWEEIKEASKDMANLMHTNVFKSDEHGLYIEGRQIMSMLREAVSILYTGIKWGNRPVGKLDNGSKGKSATSFFSERVNIPDDRIYLGRDEPDGIVQVIVHPKDKSRGSSIHYMEYCEESILSFEVEELIDSKIPTNRVPADAWSRIWNHAEGNGLGAYRSQQYGKFFVTKWEIGG